MTAHDWYTVGGMLSAFILICFFYYAVEKIIQAAERDLYRKPTGRDLTRLKGWPYRTPAHTEIIRVAADMIAERRVESISDTHRSEDSE